MSGGLLGKIPGLSRHVTAPSGPAPFDRERAISIIRGAVGEVIGCHPAGAYDWISAHEVSLKDEMSRSESDMQAAYDAGDLKAVERAARAYVATHKRAWATFIARPPVVAQGGLF